MDLKFNEYNWEQLLEEDLFLSWVLRSENSKEWESFINADPDFAKEANKARRIISILQTKYEVLDESEVRSMWMNIDVLDNELQRSERRNNIWGTLNWAATILLVLSLGVLVFYYFSTVNRDYEFTVTNLLESREAHLLLSTGEKILIAQNNRNKFKLALNDKHLLIDDSIIWIENKVPRRSGRDLNELVIPYGKMAEFNLPDGTVLWLNAGSKLAFPLGFEKNKREIYLEGEACFQVAEDKSSPFIVKAGNVNIKVLGTFFNVSAYPDQESIETVLISGKVSLKRNNAFTFDTVELIHDEKGVFSKANNTISVSAEPHAEEYVAWVNGWLEYRKESLNSVLNRLERYFDVKFHLPADFPADDKISGKLDLNRSLENVLIVLSDAANFDYKIKGGDVLIQNRVKD